MNEGKFSFGNFGEDLKNGEIGFYIRRDPKTPEIQEVFWTIKGVREESSRVTLEGNARCGNCNHLEGNRVKHCINFISEEQGTFYIGARIHTSESLSNQVYPLYPNNIQRKELHPDTLIDVGGHFMVANMLRIRREVKEQIGAD